MRKTMLILLATAVAALWCTAAMAGITATAHDQPNAAGPCAVCHLPHGSVEGGARLWPSDAVPSGTVSQLKGEVSPLCAFCHLTNGGADYPDATSDYYVYNTYSHGYMMSITTDLPSSYRASGLMYQDDATDGAIECTTCHNVHDDPTGSAGTGYAPFLRADINVLCSGCHGDRRFEGGSDASGIGTVMGAWAGSVGMLNPGSHPVGTDVTGNNTGGDSPVVFEVRYAAAFDGSAEGWDLGGHLTGGDTGGVNCISCHAVHGIQGDADGSWNGVTQGLVATEPNINFLVDEQSAINYGTRNVANGLGDANYLCEACHQGTAPNASAYPGANASNGTFYQNPGGTEFGHPVDDMQATIGWVASFPANWPSGDAAMAATNVAPVPICESCHVPHPLADAGRDDDPNSTFVNSDYILRNSSAAICADCHSGTYTAAGNRHHPVGIGYDSANVAYLTNVSGAADTLECGTCHGGGASGGAHNWAGIGQLAMDPNWLPYDNGRGTDQATDQYNSFMSATCIDCHYGIDGDETTMSPTLHNGLIYTGSNEGSFDTIGEGTHFIGEMQASWASLGATMDPENDTWGSTYGGVGAWSRFGGDATNTVIVCESCHELQPTKNFDDGHLLLGAFVEEAEGAVSDSRSEFCEGCHLPPGSHPMTGDTVTRHENDAALDTLYSEPWLDAPTSTDINVVMDDGSNIINCDSCHQVHDANGNSMTFILDTVDANVGAPVGAGMNGADWGSYGAAYVTESQTGKGGPHDAFCNECHRYQ